MEEINQLYEKINDNGNIEEIRRSIADLITVRLESIRDSLGNWEKTHFANAISNFASNLNSGNQPTYMWLRLCLFNIEKAFVPDEERDESYTPRDEQIDLLTYDQFIQAIDELRPDG